MLRSMYSGISGLKNFQTKLDVIGNNIANVNTYGFKKSRVTFADTMNQTISGASASTANRGGKNSMQVGLGSAVSTIDTIHTQSSLQNTGRSLDLGISGDGYFVVANGNALSYTRAGNFYLDNNGTLVNGDGYKVQAFDNNGVLGDVMVNVNAVMPATKTDKVEFSGNLSSDTINNKSFSQQMKVIDAFGESHTIDVHYIKTAANSWNVYIGGQSPFNPDGSLKSSLPSGAISLTFNPNGTLNNATPGSTTIKDKDGTDIVSGISLDFSKLTQTAEANTAQGIPNGSTEGSLESFTIGQTGEISGVYSNGQVTTLGTVAIAKFSNTSGLTKTGGNLFQESISSGTANIGVAGDGRGTLAAGSLEMSNVDLSEEFTDMIVAQRGLQANTRIITTSDEILQELVNLKR
ncbi:flagellar hook protein FlgE [Peribacillus huizhouensis]|uniref:Flagellar hook protein FlgE n=1 Tax=Peribacillus huizhouensis TaxID=1501239 RepID=A0ABR6CIJ6_9BACI|nr:flagellar hook protein FlgE [Peribacillus huizhouensis]MBA9024863.1 flagellar hook protein FlgE [Peribacillus huizhouensis]